MLLLFVGLTMAQNAKAPVQPPYYCTFDSAGVIDNEWIVIDGDRDGRSWSYEWNGFFYPCDGNVLSGFAAVLWNKDGNENEDWMITASPVSLPKGANHISFYYGLAQPFYVERLKVFYSKTPDTARAKLTELGTFEISVRTGWYFAHVDFELAEADDYYFSFLYQVPNDNQYGVMLDNIRIDKGKFVGTPDMRIERILLPTASCNLGTSERIGVQLKNEGSADITKWAMTYSINGGTPVHDTLSRVLAEGQSDTAYFKMPADLSAPGTDYEVAVSVEVLECNGHAEANTANNTAKNKVSHFSPLDQLPFEADLRTEEGLSQMGYNPDCWDTVQDGLNAITPDPLITRCMTLNADRHYRFIFSYKAGANGFLISPDIFDVLYGTPDKPITEWDTLKRYTTNTKNAYVLEEFVFEQKETGSYSFAIRPIRPSYGYDKTLYIASLKIEEVFEYDVRIENVRSTLAAMTPAQHIMAPQFNVSLVNRGESAVDSVKITVRKGEAFVGVSGKQSIAVDDTARYTFDGTIKRQAPGKITLTFTADMKQTDERPEDNTFEWSFTATDSLYAFDDLTIEKYSDGVGMRNLVLGNLFTLLEQDTLTAVTVGWADLSQYNLNPLVRMDIFPVNESGVAEDNIYSAELRRPLEGGIQTIQIQPRIMPAGRYMIGLIQLGNDNIAVGFDRNPNGFFYGKTGNNRVQTLSGYGFLAVRAIFGKTAEAYSKDLELLSIDKPMPRGAFSTNEPIAVSYCNNGKDAVTATIKCTVNGNTETQTVQVPGYNPAATVTFEADLSAIGTHTIVVEAVVEGDENPGNNTISASVECVETNPYVMDFELCNDFTITDLQPWRSVDVDLMPTAILRGYEWPNATKPQGFIAYNPYQTTPSIDGLIQPYEGERFGAALVCADAQNNDWLISPLLRLPENNPSVSLYTQSISELEEKFNVLVSTKSSNVNDFEKVGQTHTAPAEWAETVVDLNEYAGKEVYIAIQCVSNDALMFMVDNIRVSRPVANEFVENSRLNVHAYPNPVSDVWTVAAYGQSIQRVEIYNLAGGLVYRSANSLNTETWRIHVSAFNAGMYMARVYLKSGVQTVKMLVQ